jgi:hypothetical protein
MTTEERRAYQKARYPADRAAIAARGAVYRAANLEKIHARGARYRAANKDAIRIRALLAAQRTCCICGSAFGYQVGETRPHIDHDHKTGRVRALLCNTCNIGLGSFRDNAGLLRSAADYIEHHSRGGN